MQNYRVMKRGHKVGHHELTYGSTVTAKDLGVTDADLDVFVQRGVLRRTSVSRPAPRKTAKAGVSPTNTAESGNTDD